MALPVSEDFVGASAPLAGFWSQRKTTVTLDRDGSGAAVSSNSANEGFARWNADLFESDQKSKAIIASGLALGTGYAMVSVRNSSEVGDSDWDAYLFYTDGVNGAGHTEVAKVVDGVQTALLDFSPTAAFVAGDEIELQVVSGTLEAFKNGSSLGSLDDFTLVSGSAGCGCYGTAKLASWEGNNTVVDASPSTRTPASQRIAT